jgi:hypothetical protein
VVPLDDGVVEVEVGAVVVPEFEPVEVVLVEDGLVAVELGVEVVVPEVVPYVEVVPEDGEDPEVVPEFVPDVDP